MRCLQPQLKSNSVLCGALFLGFFVFALTGGSQTQLPEVTWSPPTKMKRSARALQMIGADSSQFYVLRGDLGRGAWDDRKLDLNIDVYNLTSLDFVDSKKIELPVFDRQYIEVVNVVIHNGQLLVLFHAWDDDTGYVRLYGQRLNQDVSIQGDAIALAEYSARRKTGGFAVQASRNQKLLLVYPEVLSERRMMDRLAFKVIDENLETLWEKDLNFPDHEVLTEIDQYRIDSRGHLYLLTGIGNRDKTLRGSDRARSEQVYTLISYDPEINKVKTYEVAVDDKWVTATAFDVTENDDVTVGGFYSNDRQFSIGGAFYFRINGSTKETEATGMMPFTADVMSLFLRPKQVERGRELNDFYFDHFIARADGGATFVAEQYFVQQSFRTDIATGRQEMLYYYYYNDLLVVDVDREGQVLWTVRVPKEQMSVNDGGQFSSYALAADDENLYIVFNDNPENIELLKANPQSEPKQMYGTRRSVATLVTLSREGKQTREALFSSRDSDVMFKPKVHMATDANTLFLYGQWRKLYRFGRLRF